MNRDDIIRMAREAGVFQHVPPTSHVSFIYDLMEFAAQVAAAEREVLANWMRQHGFITGQTYTTDSLLDRLGTEMVENTDAAVIAEREACERLAWDTPDDEETGIRTAIALAIRARGEQEQTR